MDDFDALYGNLEEEEEEKKENEKEETKNDQIVPPPPTTTTSVKKDDTILPPPQPKENDENKDEDEDDDDDELSDDEEDVQLFLKPGDITEDIAPETINTGRSVPSVEKPEEVKTEETSTSEDQEGKETTTSEIQKSTNEEDGLKIEIQGPQLDDENTKFKPMFPKSDHPTPKMNVEVMKTDLDAFATKPWLRPGSKLSQYFNYGFNEETWKLYVKKQDFLRENMHKLSTGQLSLPGGEKKRNIKMTGSGSIIGNLPPINKKPSSSGNISVIGPPLQQRNIPPPTSTIQVLSSSGTGFTGVLTSSSVRQNTSMSIGGGLKITKIIAPPEPEKKKEKSPEIVIDDPNASKEISRDIQRKGRDDSRSGLLEMKNSGLSISRIKKSSISSSRSPSSTTSSSNAIVGPPDSKKSRVVEGSRERRSYRSSREREVKMRERGGRDRERERDRAERGGRDRERERDRPRESSSSSSRGGSSSSVRSRVPSKRPSYSSRDYRDGRRGGRGGGGGGSSRGRERDVGVKRERDRDSFHSSEYQSSRKRRRF